MNAILIEPRQKSTAEQPLTRPLVVAVAGNPNAGKTTLFNVLTGLKQKVANYPGVTVESKIGSWSLAPGLPPARLIDLPGLYSLSAASLDEEIAKKVLLGDASRALQPDAIVVVVDATNLTRNLYLAIQLIETGHPVVVALTMFDLAERSKIKIDVDKLSRALGVAVVPFVATKRRGIHELAQAVLAVVSEHDCQRRRPVEARTLLDARLQEKALIKRYALIERIISEVVETGPDNRNVTERIDGIVTHRVFGPLLLLLVMTLVFQTIFSWATLPMNLIERIFGALSVAVRTHLPPGVLTDLITDGAIAGVSSVLVFVPQIFLLFLFIALLEDSGYMARAAFLMDRLMRCFGLPGKAFMPLLSSFACAVPGIMATRTLENPKDRLATILITPFMSCSARLPVYTLMIATLFSGHKVFGVISTGVLLILGMYLLGITVALIAAAILNRTILKAPKTTFVLELPPYRWPILRNVAQAIIASVGNFVKRAGTVILAVSILLWALAAFPRGQIGSGAGTPNDRETVGVATTQAALQTQSEQIRNSYAGRLGRLIEPAIAPLGFDWGIGIGLISSFAARETIVSTLSIVYNVNAESQGQSSTLVNALLRARRDDGSPVWTPLVGLSLMVFFVLACQCMSTIAIVRRETNSLRWPLFMFVYMLVIAYAGSLITYQGGRLLGYS